MTQSINYNISINKFPFIGAHNAITGSINTIIPMIKTQILSLDELYEKGVRYFDFRVDIGRNFNLNCLNRTNLYFHHTIPFNTIDNNIYITKLIQLAILNKELIVLKFSHFTLTDEENVKKEIIKYLTNNNFIKNCEIFESYLDINNTILSYLNNNIYIIILICGKIKYENNANFNENITSFNNNISCIEPNVLLLQEHKNNLLINFKNYIDNCLNRSITNNYMYIVQALLQSPTKIRDIFNFLKYTSFNNNGIININNFLNLNYKITKYIIDNNKKINSVILFDAIQDDNIIPDFKNYIESTI